MSAVTQEHLSSTMIQDYLKKQDAGNRKIRGESVAIVQVGSEATPKLVSGGNRKEAYDIRK